MSRSILDHPKVVKLCNELKEPSAKTNLKKKLKHSSKKQHIWMNLVLQGGGTLGIAHVGAIHGLELAGARFAGVAGTSAGAIAALLICSLRKSWDKAVGEELLDILSSMPAQDFIDGSYLVRRLIKDLLSENVPDLLELAIPATAGYQALTLRQGLNPGLAFEEWLARTLRNRCEIQSLNDLELHVENGRPQHLRHMKKDALRMIATALPYGHKFEFPRDRDVLTWDGAVTSPALFARASMSIPLFFEPLEAQLSENWQNQITRFARALPEELSMQMKAEKGVYFVDGGVLSNFPIDTFRSDVGFNELPTLGLSMYSTDLLADEGSKRTGIGGLINMAALIFDAARLRRDRDAANNRQPNEFVHYIDTGPHNWLNFSLSDDDITDLFYRGLNAAKIFLNQSGTRHEQQ